MIAVILAAGRSKRLQPLTNTVPKCLLHVDGQTVLSRYLSLLHNVGVEKTIIVTGFNSDAVTIEATACGAEIGMDVICIENSNYQTTHPIESLLLTEHMLTDDFFLLNSDIYFTSEVLINLMDTDSSCIAIDSQAPYIPNEMFVNYTTHNEVTAISKTLPKKTTGQGKSVQIAKIKKNDKDLFMHRAGVLSGGDKVFYPAQAYDVLIDKKLFKAVDIKGYFTHEMDTVEDYRSLQHQLNKQK